MRIAIVTDAWSPQVNGVVRTLQSVSAELRAMGHELTIISPDLYASVPCPTYPEIRLALPRPGLVGRTLAEFRAEAVHIATEGPLGLLARRWCLSHGLPFTTAYHTQFPEYVAARIKAVNPEFVWRYVRWFHAPSAAILASTPSVAQALAAHGLPQSRHWGRGVDIALFRADGPRDASVRSLASPVQLYAGRVAVEKNIAAFLATDLPGSKVVVGDGPARAALAAEYPHVHFLGAKFGEDLAAIYRAADVFVFPSRTDTFGLVMIEALACGTPVAALPVQGPLDVLNPQVGVMDDALDRAIAGALTLDRETCAHFGQGFTWRASAEQFLSALAPIDQGMRAAA
ncbi:glycosyltransferase family 4 protein [Sphingomonas sanguinis]|uniref:GDP-mannose-dependent alpha-mannosyltransferase n=1 Tax=Sphingomonas sanguinis TaxID=33051 RepID=A0A147J1X1_9SPHN|nr:glycosyltransferase family 1 protein [Sphingomonas sanguinis]KTW02601.1 GDP-mannose-dependent alpha-mannosyltransferase [Sphingomonas sanguinis]